MRNLNADVFLKGQLFSKSTLNLVHFDTGSKNFAFSQWQGSLGSSV